jgi:hypothetical protein
MMNNVSLRVLPFSIVAMVGCGASNTGLSGPDTGADTAVPYPATCGADAVLSPGLVVPADFSRMTWHVSDGTTPAYQSCPVQEGVTIILDALTSTLSWDGVRILSADAKTCQTKGQLALTRTQVEALWQVGPTQIVDGPAGCLAATLITLDVDRCGQTTRYVDSHQGCQASPDLIVATDVQKPIASIRELLPNVLGEAPVFVASEGFVSFTLHSSGGMPNAPDARSTCNVSYKDKYSVDATARTFTWDYCKWTSSGNAPATGSRTLTDDELVRLTRALSFLKLHEGYGCGADKPKITLDLETSAGTATYSDSFYACNAQPGEIFVDNIDELDYALFALLK